jgi:hypothetical protein
LEAHATEHSQIKGFAVILFRMAIDDNPIEVLIRQFELEDLSKSPVSQVVTKVSAGLAKLLPIPIPLQSVIETISDRINTDSIERIVILIKTVADEVLKHDREISQLRETMSAEQAKERYEQQARLVVDGARRASVTRSIERVKRIGVILAWSFRNSKPPDEDEIEEMMRVATDLTDVDANYLRQLATIQGQFLVAKPHIERYNAYQSWERGPWGTRVNPELDSVFHKLESYGLVSAIAPNSTLNILADIQTRFALLPKGKRFADMITP